MELRDKEVNFGLWCYKCLYYDEQEWEDPCDECLNSPKNEYSSRPVCFEEA